MLHRREERDRRDYWDVQTFCLLALTLIAIGAALYFLRPVLVPFVLAVFLTNCLMPIVEVQQRRLHVPRSIAIASTVLLTLVIAALCGSLVAASVNSASQRLKEYEREFQHFPQVVAHWGPVQQLHLDTDSLTHFFSVQEGTGWQFISTVLGEATNILSGGLIVMIFMIFLVAGRANRRNHSGMLGEIEANVQRYVITLVFVSLGTALLVGLVLAVLGVELAWVFALLTFLLNFVPNIGPIIAWLLPLPVIVLSPDMSITAKVLALAIPAAIHFIGGNYLLPRVQGNALALHPVAVLLALMFFGMIWGVTGAFLAAPITGVVRIVCAPDSGHAAGCRPARGKSRPVFPDDQ